MLSEHLVVVLQLSHWREQTHSLVSQEVLGLLVPFLYCQGDVTVFLIFK